MRDPGSIPRGVLMWNQGSPVSVVWLQACVSSESQTPHLWMRQKTFAFWEGQSPNSQTFWNDSWATNVSARLPSKSADIFNVECKRRVILSNFMFFLVLHKNNLTIKGGHSQFKSATPQYCGQPNWLRSCGLKKVAELRLRTLKIWLPQFRYFLVPFLHLRMVLKINQKYF